MKKYATALMFPVAVGWCVALFAARVAATGTPHFGFLLWNLFLALVPLGLSLALARVKDRRLGLAVAAGWLLFFPNAPYMLTDLIHLKQKDGVPLWFDLILLLSFALVALACGLHSLRGVHVWFERTFSPLVGWVTVLFSLGLTGFGIYLGRFPRWNSWDVVGRPGELLADIADRFLNPFSHPRTWAFTIGFSGLLTLIYLMWLMNEPETVVRRGTGSLTDKHFQA